MMNRMKMIQTSKKERKCTNSKQRNGTRKRWTRDQDQMPDGPTDYK